MGKETLGYDVQHWLESAAQGYLLGTEYGHLPGEVEPEALLGNEALREAALDVTAQLVAFERCALDATSGLVRLAPDDATRAFLATQALDEARHAEVFRQRMLDLGVARGGLDAEIQARTSPALRRFTQALCEPVDRGDFVLGFVAVNVFMEGMAGHVFALLHAVNETVNPKFARTLTGVLADEDRHAHYGERRVRELLGEASGREERFEGLRRQLAAAMLDTFARAFRAAPRGAQRAQLRAELLRRGGGAPLPRTLWRGRPVEELEPEELERCLAEAVLGEWNRRLARLGLAPPGDAP